MPEDFVPSTTMERAYVQARHWPADRAWRRAYVQMSEGQVAPGVGMYLCLLNHYARRDGIRELFETCEWLLTRMEQLGPAERLSMCRIVCHIAKSLKEDEFDVREARLKLILRIPLAVILDAVAEHRLSCALTGLLEFSRVFEESITIKQCSDIEGDFMGVALAIDRAIRAGNVRDRVKASENKTREEYDRERLEAINLADVIRQKIEIDQKTTSVWAPGPGSKSMGDVLKQATEAPDQPNLAVPGSEAQIISDKQAALDKLEKAKGDVVSAIKSFGLRSDQVAHKLADLIVVKSEHFPDMVLNADIQHLSEIVAADEVDISPYVLRKILSAMGATDERKGLLSVLSAIERAVLAKREKQIGVDLSLGITLWRLISLWRENDSLAEGSAYCELLRQRLAEHRDMSDPVVRQVSSAVKFMAFLKSGSFKRKERFLGAQSKKIDEAAEFAAMLSTIALDNVCNGSVQNAELVMNELLCFYADTVGDTSRQVGEMMWLLLETRLNQLPKSTMSLIRQSQKLAKDDYLSARLKSNIKRLLGFVENQERRTELLSCLILAKSESKFKEDAIEEMKQILALCTFKENYEAEAKAELDHVMTGVWKNSKSVSTMLELEEYCMEKQWKKLSELWAKNKELINVEESFYRLVQLGIQLIRYERVDDCESVLDLLFSYTSKSCIHAFNYLAEQFIRELLNRGEIERAATKLELVLVLEIQPLESKNRQRIQLAEIKASLGNLFESTVLIYQTFSNIPDANYDSTSPLQLEGS